MFALRNMMIVVLIALGSLVPANALANKACVEEHLSQTAFRLDVKLGAPAETDEQRIAAFLQRVGSDLSPSDYAGLCRFLDTDSGAAALADAKWRVFEGSKLAIADLELSSRSFSYQPVDDGYCRSGCLTSETDLHSDENIDLANSLTRYKLTQYYFRVQPPLLQANLDKNSSYHQRLILEFYQSNTVSASDIEIIGNYFSEFEFISSNTVSFHLIDNLVEAHVFFPFNSIYFNKERLRADPNLIASRVAPEIDGLLEPLDGYRLLRIRPGTDVCAAKLSYILDEDERERVKIVFDYARSLAQAKRRKDRTDFDNALRAFVPNCT